MLSFALFYELFDVADSMPCGLVDTLLQLVVDLLFTGKVPVHGGSTVSELGQQVVFGLFDDPLIKLIVAKVVLHVSTRHGVYTLWSKFQIVNYDRVAKMRSATRKEIYRLFGQLYKLVSDVGSEEKLLVFLSFTVDVVLDTLAGCHVVYILRLVVGNIKTFGQLLYPFMSNKLFLWHVWIFFTI